MKVIGREKEQEKLKGALEKEESQLIALYGRRRVGKTYLIEMKNTSFLKILDGIQKDLALAYMSSDTISNKEISWMLGYNDISNFYRAFKRWTGTTPNDYRLTNA